MTNLFLIIVIEFEWIFKVVNESPKHCFFPKKKRNKKLNRFNNYRNDSVLFLYFF